MVHAAMARLQPGEVLVLTMPEPAPVALVGDLLATQAQVRGAAAILVDAVGARPRGAREIGLPIWARWVRVARRHQGRRRASSTCPSRSAARRSAPATWSCSTPTASAVVERERAAEVLAGVARARGERARSSARKLQDGALSYELDGLRAIVEGS